MDFAKILALRTLSWLLLQNETPRNNSTEKRGLRSRKLCDQSFLCRFFIPNLDVKYIYVRKCSSAPCTYIIQKGLHFNDLLTL